MKNFEQEVIDLRKDFMIAHTDISYLSMSSTMCFGGDETWLEWSVSCSVHKTVAPQYEDPDPTITVRGKMEHIHGCRDLGWALEECYRRAAWNLSTGNLDR